MNIIARIGLMLGLVLTLSNARAIEVKLPFVGQLSESGALVNGTKTMRFQIVDAPGTIRYETGPLSIPVSNGAFSVVLGGANQPALDSSVFTAFGLKLHVLVEGVSLSPDLDVPFSAYAANAVSAQVADLLDGRDSTEFARLGEHNIFNAGQTFQPTTDSSSLLVRQTSAPSPTSDIFHIQNSDGSTSHFRINSSGQLSWPGLAAGSISGNAAAASIADLFDGHDSHEFALVGEQNIFTAGQIFRPTLDSSSLVVRQTSAGSPTRDIFSVESADSTQSYLRISSLGQLSWPGIAAGSISGNAATATDAGKLNGRPGTFYNDAANLTGTISDARLPANVMRVDQPQTFTATKTFQSATDNPGVIVRQTPIASPTSDIFQVESPDSTASYLRVNSSGQLRWAGTATGSISGNAATADVADLFDGYDSTEFARLGEHNIFREGQTFQPTTDSSSLLVRQSSAASPTSDIFHVQNSDGTTTHFSISNSGQLSWPGLAAGSISGNAATASIADLFDGHDSHDFALVGEQNIFTAGQIFRPTLDASSVIVRQTSAGSPTRDIFSVESADSTQSYFRISSLGQLIWPGTALGSISGNAATATDAGKLNGRPGTFYNDAANLTGTISDARLSASVALLNEPQTFSATKIFQSATDSPSVVIRQTLSASPTSDVFQVESPDSTATYLRVNNSGQLSWSGTAQGGISGNATTATDASQLNGHTGNFYQDAANLIAGTLPDGRLAGTYSDAVSFNNPGNTFSGMHSGNGAALAELNASSLATGTTAPARGGTGIDSSGAAAGSIFYTVAPGTWGLLPAGSANQVLKVVDGLPAWGTDNTGDVNIAAGTGIMTSSTSPSAWTVSIDTAVVPLKSAPNTFTTSQSIELGDGALKALVVKGAPSQSANLQEWQDGSGVALASVDGSGGLTAASLTINAGLQMFGGSAGLGRVALVNTLEVAGDASKDIAGSWAANSDRRIKTDVETITNALETLDNVRLVSFRYTDEYRAGHPSIEDRRYMNVLAQEFQKIFPDNVKGSGEKLANGGEILQVDTYPLTIYSAAAVQELHQQMKERDARIANLEKTVAELKKLLSLLAASNVPASGLGDSSPGASQ